LTAGLDGAIVARMPQIDIEEDPSGKKCEACLCATAAPPGADVADRKTVISQSFCLGAAIALVHGPLEGHLSFCPTHFAAMKRLLAACAVVGNRGVQPSRN
jgi:hypothetical protein